MIDVPRVLTRRCRALTGSGPPCGDAAASAALVAEAATIGVRIANPERVTLATLTDWPEAAAEVLAMRGGGRDYAPLFDGFPDRLPAYDDAGLRFAVAEARLIYRALDRADAEGGDTLVGLLSADDVRAAMDFTDWGWWPASSVDQDVDASRAQKAAQRRLAADGHVEWLTLTIVDDPGATLRDWMAAAVYRPSSLAPHERDDLAVLLDVFGVDWIDGDRVTFRETRALLDTHLFAAAVLGDAAAYAEFTSGRLTPDDLLRVLASLTGSDVSLAEKVRFPALRRPERRLILQALDAAARPRDVWRRRGLWLALARSLHPADYRQVAPDAAALLAALARVRRDPDRLASVVEKALAAAEPAYAATILEREAPGVLIRQARRIVHAAYRTGSDRAVNATLLAVKAAAPRAPMRTLVAASGAVRDNGQTYPRLAITKRGQPLVVPGDVTVDGPRQHLTLPTPIGADLLAVLTSALTWQAAQRPVEWPDGPVWVDRACDGLLIPDQARDASDTIRVLDRGSRVRTPRESPVLRLFVHWTEPPDERSDLDLSVLFLDWAAGEIGHVSWTNLAAYGAVHSGDVTSAPDGASEFIDLAVDRLPADVRYVAPAVYRFAGPAFADLPEATVGWMHRDAVDGDRRTFDVAAVADAYALRGRGGTAYPFLYDVRERQVIWLDLYASSGWGARVTSDRSLAHLAILTAGRRNFRRDVGWLARLYAKAKGRHMTSVRGEAAVTFGVDDDCTYNAVRPSRLLADLL